MWWSGFFWGCLAGGAAMTILSLFIILPLLDFAGTCAALFRR